MATPKKVLSFMMRDSLGPFHWVDKASLDKGGNGRLNGMAQMYKLYDQKNRTIEEIAQAISRGIPLHSYIVNTPFPLDRPSANGNSFGTILHEDAIGWYMVGLDFEHMTTLPEEQITLIKNAGLPVPNIYYYTFSDDPDSPNERRYRLMWFFDTRFTADDYTTFAILFASVCKMDFRNNGTECGLDDVSFEPFQLWHGTDSQVVYVRKKPYTMDDILKCKDGASKSKNGASFWFSTYPTHTKRLMNSSILSPTLYNIKENGQKFSTAGALSEPDPELATLKNTPILKLSRPEKDLLDFMYNYYPRWRALVDGTFFAPRKNNEQRGFKQMWALLNNLALIEYPRNHHGKDDGALFTGWLDAIAYYRNINDEWTEPYGWASDESLKKQWTLYLGDAYPMVVAPNGGWYTLYDALSHYNDLYSQDWENDFNLDDFTHKSIGGLNKMTIKEAIDNPFTTYLIAPTAIGKTQHIINWLGSIDLNEKRVIYTVPTHKLAKEFISRFRQVCPIAPIYYKGEKDYSEHALERLELSVHASGEDKDWTALERNPFWPALRTPTSGGLFIMTHQAFVCMNKAENIYRVIVDENIEEALFTKIQANSSCLMRLAQFTSNPECRETFTKLAGIAEAQTKSKEHNVYRCSATEIEAFHHVASEINYHKGEGAERYMSMTPRSERVAHIGKLAEIERGFIYLGSFWSFTTTMPLTEYSNVLLMTATPLIATIKMMFPQFCAEVWEVDAPPTKGKVVAYVGTSGAKANKFDNIKYADHIARNHMNNDAYILTFKNHIMDYLEAGLTIPAIIDDKLVGLKKEDFTDATPLQAKALLSSCLHIQNCAGIDALKGKNVIVAGKFDLNYDDYRVRYFYANPYATEEPGLSFHEVKLKNKRFRIWLFNDDELRAIQEENLYYYTAQAAGRARALRESDANVAIISNYPIKDANYLNMLAL